MSLQVIVQELRALPWVVIVLQTELALGCIIAYQAGKYKGLNQRPEAWKAELAQARFELVQAEERLEAERRVSKRLEVIVSQFSQNGRERLVEVGRSKR